MSSILIIMGVSGCGKTTIGSLLSEKLRYEFADADDYHSADNKRKMSEGIPLTDEDRFDWLLALHHLLNRWQTENIKGILCCSALKKKYRYILTHGGVNEVEDSIVGNSVLSLNIPCTLSTHLLNTCTLSSKLCSINATFVYLQGSKEVIQNRLNNRAGHFMPSSLLSSQFLALEEPGPDEVCIYANICNEPENIVAAIINQLKLD